MRAWRHCHQLTGRHLGHRLSLLTIAVLCFSTSAPRATSAAVAATIPCTTPGTVCAWGWNSEGSLGSGGQNPRAVPGPVHALGEVVSVASGTLSAYAIHKDGTVWAWGANSWGQLGNGTTDGSALPVQVGNLTNIKAVAANYYSAFALATDGTVWAWGGRYLGNEEASSSTVPVRAQGLSNVVSIAANESGSSAYALKSDGPVWAWGGNSSGQLGIGTNLPSDVPEQVLGVTSATALCIIR